MSAPVRQIAIVSETDKLTLANLVLVSAALQKQVTQDFGPIWEVSATVDAFEAIEDVPPGYWEIILRDDIEDTNSALGFHSNNGQPFALVQFRPGWELTASHECLEMLADPSGRLTQSGLSIQPGREGEQVNYLVEICDPCQDVKYAYPVNDLHLSDFCTPEYYNMPGATGARLSFSGEISAPRQVLNGGYLSFQYLGSNEWFRAENLSGKMILTDLGEIELPGDAVRSRIDHLARHAAQLRQKAKGRRSQVSRRLAHGTPKISMDLPAIARARYSRAKRLHAKIDELILSGQREADR